ncbi:unnamed protein product [Dovyalis caffra]|uniref:Uncharacterized protein n=1 Tax=Dovyalis caffra TaxID=77055 RepID=A0AAV1S1B4_9ROSI|nr:unnamed protein product [Dovyalis caffra]
MEKTVRTEKRSDPNSFTRTSIDSNFLSHRPRTPDLSIYVLEHNPNKPERIRDALVLPGLFWVKMPTIASCWDPALALQLVTPPHRTGRCTPRQVIDNKKYRYIRNYVLSDSVQDTLQFRATVLPFTFDSTN